MCHLHTAHRSVRIDSEGRVQEGGVSEGEVLAIHIGATGRFSKKNGPKTGEL